ncbi:MAG: hypothetical protein GC129_01350 [Proteobacteria bacterium]|nr:hypothetical protein [Pseudomonadota bacterium]
MVGIRRVVGRPRRVRQASAFPLLPLLAAVLLTLAAVRLGSWSWHWLNMPHASNPVDEVLSGNPFKDMALVHPKAALPPEAGRQPWRVVLPAQPSNLQFGNPSAAVVATVLTDPACGACRAQVDEWLKKLPRGVRVVYKFWPAQAQRLTPGMLLELARRKGVTADYLQRLDRADGDLSDTEMLAMLEQAGVPLDAQRAALSDANNGLGKVLDADLALATSLKMPPPPVLTLNGYVIDGQVLSEDKIATYAERLANHQPLTQDSDYWLMDK